MDKDEIQKLIKELVEKTTVKLNEVSVVEEGPKNIWVSVEVSEPHFFISHDGEGLQALNHIVHRIVESKTSFSQPEKGVGGSIIIDVNGFQKKVQRTPKSEIDLASTVENGYSRTIRLPATLDGKNYIFALGDTGQSTAREVFTELDGNQFSEILAVDISGVGVSYELTDQKQFLTIVKNNNQVMIQKSS